MEKCNHLSNFLFVASMCFQLTWVPGGNIFPNYSDLTKIIKKKKNYEKKKKNERPTKTT